MEAGSTIVNAHIISPGVDIPCATVVSCGGKIVSVAESAPAPAPAKAYDAAGAYLMPGFIDMHTHGAAGCDSCDEDPRTIFEIAKAKLAEGVTTFLPTTLTVSHETLMASAANAAAYAAAGMPYAKTPGIHLEGPFINPKCCGSQNPGYARKCDIAEVEEIASVFPVKAITYAIETEGGDDFAAACAARGIIPSCGHTAAKYADFKKAYARGLRRMTHFCNQMTPLHHREIGMVGAALLVQDVDTEVICDKIHLCPEMLELVFSIRPLEHIQMITDSLRCSHCPDGYSFTMGGIEVRLEDGCARVAGKGNLAGSTLWFGDGLRNVHETTGIPLKDLVRTTSWNQAISLGLGDTLGKIERGYTADFVIVDAASWRPKAVFVEGVARA